MKTTLAILLAAIVAACAPAAAPPAQPAGNSTPNPVVYFEIPVSDMARAIAFYSAVFEIELTRETVDGYDMALFPGAPGRAGAVGALAKGDVYVPSLNGPIIYFGVADIAPVLARAVANGGRVLYAKKNIGANGFVAEFQDSEGNRIALNAPEDPP